MKEQKHFQSIKTDYSLSAINDCLRLVCEEGIPGSNAKCHSPMAFLACSIGNVLRIVEERRLKIQRKESLLQAEQQKQLQKQKQEAEEESRLEEYRKLFERAFPEPQQRETFFREFATQFPFFKSNSIALQNAAISSWGSTLKQ